MKFKLLYGAFIATVLTACGGGGGGSSDSGGSGGGGGGGGGTTPANNAPVFSSSDTASVLEGQTAVITVEASDEDSDTLTYALSGDDSALFSLSDSNQLASLRRRILKRQRIVVAIMCTALLLPWMTERTALPRACQ